jgi:hypothetical protein
LTSVKKRPPVPVQSGRAAKLPVFQQSERLLEGPGVMEAFPEESLPDGHRRCAIAGASAAIGFAIAVCNHVTSASLSPHTGADVPAAHLSETAKETGQSCPNTSPGCCF